MPDIIHLLPDSVANQIAAGEVIQRPASVVKELLENAVDAGATSIKVIIRDAGKTLIQVIDNGCGMSETDARMALERHATSKIKQIEDLLDLHTMGFRGEALASIVAVAQVEIRTRLQGEELGTQLIVEGSEVKSQQPCHCPEGTSITVKNLFFNVPARRNFLKSNPAETRHIIDEFQRVAIAHPQIAFSLHHNDVIVYQLPPSNLKQRIVNVMGNHYNERLVPVQEATDVLRIRGFISKPEFTKKTRGEQFFFVNNRFIRDTYLNHAVMSAYTDLIPKGNFPLYVLFLDIKPSMIDVNVHPTKQEIKFEDERLVYAVIRAAVRHALGQYSIAPLLDFEQEQTLEQFTLPPSPPFNKQAQAVPTSSASQQQHLRSVYLSAPERMSNKADWQQLYQILHQTEKTGPSTPLQQTLHTEWDNKPEQETEPYQVHRQYIFTHIKSGLLIIDQQAAHERILYEKYLRAFSRKEQITSQKQLFPQMVSLPYSDAELVREMLPELHLLGLQIEEFGQNTFVLHGVPATFTFENENYQQALEQLLEQYKHHTDKLGLEKKEKLALSLARFAAIKPGKLLSPAEMTSLVDELFACNQPYLSPSGQPTLTILTLEEIKKIFQNK